VLTRVKIYKFFKYQKNFEVSDFQIFSKYFENLVAKKNFEKKSSSLFLNWLKRPHKNKIWPILQKILRKNFHTPRASPTEKFISAVRVGNSLIVIKNQHRIRLTRGFRDENPSFLGKKCDFRNKLSFFKKNINFWIKILFLKAHNKIWRKTVYSKSWTCVVDFDPKSNGGHATVNSDCFLQLSEIWYLFKINIQFSNEVPQMILKGRPKGWNQRSAKLDRIVLELLDRIGLYRFFR
jgi:hypothetical protein